MYKDLFRDFDFFAKVTKFWGKQSHILPYLDNGVFTITKLGQNLKKIYLSQMWLIPLVDDCQSIYLTKLKEKLWPCQSRRGNCLPMKIELLVVKSQTASLTPGLSFCHNLSYRCPNALYKPNFDIHTSIAFQWYKKHPNVRCFHLCTIRWRWKHLFRECESHPNTDSK